MITELNERTRYIFRHIVDTYLETGEAIGSRTLSERLASTLSLSPATLRNIMADLEHGGFLFAPHTSAGRLPTQKGLRFYVDGLMQVGQLSEEERTGIEAACKNVGHSMADLYEQAGTLLSGLSAGAGMVIAPKKDKPVQEIQFIQLDNGQILIVLVFRDGMVENRIMETPMEISPSSLQAAAAYLNNRMAGKTLAEAREEILSDIASHSARLDKLTEDLVERGLALKPNLTGEAHIIIKGQSRLLNDVRAIEDLEHARHLLESLEEEKTMLKILEQANHASGVQIYIGTENNMFSHSGWSMVLSPCRNEENHIIGAIGVIGPVRLNYGRIIPLVDYTSQVIGKMIGNTSL